MRIIISLQYLIMLIIHGNSRIDQNAATPLAGAHACLRRTASASDVPPLGGGLGDSLGEGAVGDGERKRLTPWPA